MVERNTQEITKKIFYSEAPSMGTTVPAAKQSSGVKLTFEASSVENPQQSNPYNLQSQLTDICQTSVRFGRFWKMPHAQLFVVSISLKRGMICNMVL